MPGHVGIESLENADNGRCKTINDIHNHTMEVSAIERLLNPKSSTVKCIIQSKKVVQKWLDVDMNVR